MLCAMPYAVINCYMFRDAVDAGAGANHRTRYDKMYPEVYERPGTKTRIRGGNGVPCTMDGRCLQFFLHIATG